MTFILLLILLSTTQAVSADHLNLSSQDLKIRNVVIAAPFIYENFAFSEIAKTFALEKNNDNSYELSLYSKNEFPICHPWLDINSAIKNLNIDIDLSQATSMIWHNSMGKSWSLEGGIALSLPQGVLFYSKEECKIFSVETNKRALSNITLNLFDSGSNIKRFITGCLDNRLYLINIDNNAISEIELSMAMNSGLIINDSIVLLSHTNSSCHAFHIPTQTLTLIPDLKIGYFSKCEIIDDKICLQSFKEKRWLFGIGPKYIENSRTVYSLKKLEQLFK